LLHIALVTSALAVEDQHRAILCPEYTQKITAHPDIFPDCYRVQPAAWHAHDGSPARGAPEEAMEMLLEHCCDLCIVLSDVI